MTRAIATIAVGTALLSADVVPVLVEAFRLVPMRRVPGAGSLAAIAVFVAGTRTTIWRLPRTGALLIVLTAVAVMYAQASLPEAVADWSAPSVIGPLTLATVTGGVYVLLKQLLLRRLFTAEQSQRSGSVGPGAAKLLPTQEADLARLKQTMERPSDDATGRVVQLTGRWGDGKSYLLRQLSTSLEAKEPWAQPAVTIIDVWKHESEPELHLAMVRRVLGHPEHSRGCAWLRHPLLLLLGAWPHEMRMELLARIGQHGDIAMGLRLPRLVLQRCLEQVAARARRNRVPVVIILDEIDRATPAVTQAAMTLVRRSLDLPGVTVLLSYVDATIRYKAFNPLVVEMEDLRSTIMAVIYHERTESGTSDSVARSLKWPSPGEGRDMDTVLVEEFVQAPPAARRRMEMRFSEKYLGTNPFAISRLTLDDLAAVPFLFQSLRPLVERLEPVGTDAERLADYTRNVLHRWQEEVVVPRDPPPVRAVEGALFGVLHRGCQVAGDVPRSPEELAALMIAALEVEALIQTNSDIDGRTNAGGDQPIGA